MGVISPTREPPMLSSAELPGPQALPPSGVPRRPARFPRRFRHRLAPRQEADARQAGPGNPRLLPPRSSPVITGYALLLLLSREGIIGRFLNWAFGIDLLFTWIAAALAAGLVSLPLMVRAIEVALAGVDPRLEKPPAASAPAPSAPSSPSPSRWHTGAWRRRPSSASPAASESSAQP